MRVGGQTHDPADLPQGRSCSTNRTRGWLGPRDGLDGCAEEEIYALTGIRTSIYTYVYDHHSTFRMPNYKFW